MPGQLVAYFNSIPISFFIRPVHVSSLVEDDRHRIRIRVPFLMAIGLTTATTTIVIVRPTTGPIPHPTTATTETIAAMVTRPIVTTVTCPIVVMVTPRAPMVITGAVIDARCRAALTTLASRATDLALLLSGAKRPRQPIYNKRSCWLLEQ